ncbi:MAG TPA: penicillin-binding protein 2 [Candidatus Paceibacterota bacterium]|jgi:cell division protein FtsI/penicillin-binding protein 2
MRRAYRLRLRVVSIGVIAFALLLASRLYFVQVVQGEEFALRAERQYVSSSQKLFNRGSIYFTRKDGTLISAATLENGFILAIDPDAIRDADTAYKALAKHVPDLDRAAFMAAAGKEDDPYEVIRRRLSDDVGRAIDTEDIPGVIVERERWRSYPAGAHAAQSIGIIAYDNDNTIAGRLGLERYYNDVLTHDGEGVFGNFFAELFANLDSVIVDARSAREGDVITALEPVAQQKLEQILKETNTRYGSRETGGIIMDPKTGEIVAMGTYPSFDPNSFQSEDSEYFGNPLVEKRYEFGSILKPLTVTAGLDAGVITPQTTYNDTGCMTLNTREFCNYDLKARGVVPIQEILSQSLNLGTTFVSMRLGHDRFRKYFTALGLDQETGIDLPSEIHGDIRNLESPRDIEYANASFGQGIAMTPVETIRALGTLANGGQMVTPHLATAVRLESGVTRKLTWGDPKRVFGPDSVRAATDMLVTVVDTKLGGGTAKIPSMTVAAKTGTAQIAAPGGGYYDDLYLHSFFGYFPAYEPEYVILLYTREPHGVQYASETLTGPFIDLTHFLINYYEIPPDRANYAGR